MNPAAFGVLPASACSLGTEGSDGPDRITRTFYDSAGRVQQVKSAVGTADEAADATTTYTANGRVQTVTDGENNKTTYEYDGHDRLSKTYFPLPAKGAGASNAADHEEATYDSGGNVSSFRNRANETLSFTHDSLDRLTFKDLPGSEPDVTYSYDLLGRMTGASQAGHALGFTYDSLGRLVAQSNPIGTVTAEYDLAGRRTLLKWPADPAFPLGHKAVYEHLVTGEVSVMREGAPLTGPIDASFAYDDLGRRVAISRGNGASTAYAFDAASRLSSISHDFAGTTRDLTLGFSHNPAGQIVSGTRSNDAYSWTGHGSGATASTPNGLNQLADHGGAAFTYDPKGNLASDGMRSFGYSSENLALTQVGGSSTITRTYDPLNRLSSTYATGAKAPSHFLWFGDELIGEYHSGNVVGRFVHGPGVDEPMLIVARDGTRTWLHADERGSIIARSDATGAAPWVVTYDEYGRSPSAFRFGFTGQMHLSGSLYHYKSRMYDAALGRFLQTDPIGYGDGMNMYAYVKGDPVNFIDPMGLEWRRKCVSAGDGKADCGYYWVNGGGAALLGSGRGGTGTGGGAEPTVGGADAGEQSCPPPGDASFLTPEDAGLAGAQAQRQAQRAARNGKGDNLERSFGLRTSPKGGYGYFFGRQIGTEKSVDIPYTKIGGGHLHTIGGGNTLSRASDISGPFNRGDVDYALAGLRELEKRGDDVRQTVTILGAENGTVYAWRGRNLRGPGKPIGPDTCK